MNGKVDSIGSLTEVPLSEAHKQEDASELEERLRAIWESAAKVVVPSVDDDLRQFGGDSLMLAELAAVVERDFGIVPAIDQLLDNFTIRGIAQEIEVELIRAIQANDQTTKLG